MKYQISLSTEFGKQKKLLLARKMIAIITVDLEVDRVSWKNQAQLLSLKKIDIKTNQGKETSGIFLKYHLWTSQTVHSFLFFDFFLIIQKFY